MSGSFAVGPFVDEWQQSYEKIFKDIEEIDVAPAISAAALSVKDERELVMAPLNFLHETCINNLKTASYT